MNKLVTCNSRAFATEPYSRAVKSVSFSSGNIDQTELTKGSSKADSSRCLLIGFDTEYQTFGAIPTNEIDAGNALNEVLSYQYCIKLLDERVDKANWQEAAGIIIPEEGNRIDLASFVAFAIGALVENHPSLVLPSDIYLVGHFTRADLPAFTDMSEISKNFLANIRNTFVSTTSFVPVSVVDGAGEHVAKLKLHLRDTMLMAPANAKSLADLGEIVGFEKIKLADTPVEEREIKSNMRRFRETHWEAFRAYAIRDAEVCVRYAEQMIAQFAKLFGDFELPLTLTQFGTKLVQAQWYKDKVDSVMLLGREEVTEKVYNPHLKRYEKKKSYPFIEEIYYDIPLVTETYHGGRNEQFEFGICPEGRWRDHDLSSAYTTAMSLIGMPIWRQARQLNNVEDVGPLDFAFFSVDFEFPQDTRFPVLPVRTSNGIVFPLAGRSLCAAPEIFLAQKMGAKLTFRRGISVPVDPTRPIFKSFITSCIAKRSEFPKNSFGNLFWKEVGNSTYGKTAQGLQKKRVYKLSSDDMEQLPESPITQPFFASFITSFTRAVLGEILNGFSPNVRVFSVTTDGFLSNANDEEIGKACSGPLFKSFAQGRLSLDPNSVPLEVKHEIKQPLGWRTRGSATLVPGDDPNKGIVLQKGGIKTPELMSHSEQNAHLVNLFFDRKPTDMLEYSVGLGLKDMVRKGADFVHKEVTKRLSMEFDWKRLPRDAANLNAQFEGQARTHLSFSTMPHPDVGSFNHVRDAWERYDGKTHHNLRSVSDLDQFLTYCSLRKGQNADVVRYISHTDGDLKRLRRDLCRAFAHSAAGFDRVRYRTKVLYKGFAAVLTKYGLTCKESDVDNGKRVAFKPHQSLPTERVVKILEDLKRDCFPELEIDMILAGRELDHKTISAANDDVPTVQAHAA